MEQPQDEGLPRSTINARLTHGILHTHHWRHSGSEFWRRGQLPAALAQRPVVAVADLEGQPARRLLRGGLCLLCSCGRLQHGWWGCR